MNTLEIERQARLVSALADTISGRDWSDAILTKCSQIELAVKVIRREVSKNVGGDR